MVQPVYSSANQIDLLAGGGKFFPALLAAIDGACHEVYLETYIFQLDAIGTSVADGLIKAAKRGIRVFVIVDWVGTGNAQAKALRALLVPAGVRLHIFNPWFRRGISRTHRKMCVVDRSQAFVGGININDDWIADHDPKLRLPAPRWDFAVGIRGPLVADVSQSLHAQWARSGKLGLRSRLELMRPSYRAALGRGRRDLEGADTSQSMRASLVVRDNLLNRRSIQRAYLQALGHARESILFANPYFAPSRKLRRALEAAASRGVQVTLLLGVGQFPLQDAVAHSFYPRLLRCGVTIVEYRHTQLHGKVAVVDDMWATVGSSNYDGLSMFVNQEANVVVQDKGFATTLRDEIKHAIAQGDLVKANAYMNVPWYKRVAYAGALFIYATLIRIFTWSSYT